MPPANRRRRGLMLVLSSPSGAGKTTLTRMLTRDDAEVELSVSWTTRAARSNEIDGVHYKFVDKDSFRAHRAADSFARAGLRRDGRRAFCAAAFRRLYLLQRRRCFGRLVDDFL